MTSEVKVKVCGIRRSVDAERAVELGADALGFVFWPASPRAVTATLVLEITRRLPPFTAAVGVFVNQPADEVLRTADAAGLTAVQLHGDEDPADFVERGYAVIKAIGVEGSAAPSVAGLPSAVTVLLDAHDPVRRGGTGRTIDWPVAAEVARARRVILSGGLAPGNVAAAIAAVRPYAVDVSSGVEMAPGVKDEEKLRAFFAAVRVETVVRHDS